MEESEDQPVESRSGWEMKIVQTLVESGHAKYKHNKVNNRVLVNLNKSIQLETLRMAL